MAPLPDAPWADCFQDPDLPGVPAVIELQQVTHKAFVLRSSLEYIGETGVPDLPEEATVLRPEDLGDPALTDLASVPPALRWFVGPYGVHTPAALLHDRLVGPANELGVSATHADRFFRFMLKELGVRLVRRWLMWTAVAFGTRWRSTRLRPALLLWVLASVTGMSVLAYASFTQAWSLVLLALLAPVPASLLWGRQYGAGLVAAATAVWVLPPTILAAAGYCVYWVVERAVALLPLGREVEGDQPAEYRHF